MQGSILCQKLTIIYHLKKGWEPQSYHVVEVSTSKGNPTFAAILYTGFLDPENKLHGSYDNFEYIKPIRKIDMAIPNKDKQITELNLFELKTHEKVCT